MEAPNVKYFTPFLPESSRSKMFGIPSLLISEWVMPKLHFYHVMSTPEIEPGKFKRFKQPTTRGFEYYMNVVGDINLKSVTPL